jgi:Domain of unknown function DUF29
MRLPGFGLRSAPGAMKLRYSSAKVWSELMSTVTDYDRDLLVWSERQAALLRRVAAGDRVNDQIDWSNVAEEVEALGKSERRELQSRIAIVLLHLIKLQASPATDPRRLARNGTQATPGYSDVAGRQPEFAVCRQRYNWAREGAEASMADRGETPRVDPVLLVYGRPGSGSLVALRVLDQQRTLGARADRSPQRT